MSKIKTIGSKTKWGKIAMVRTIEKERYYFMINKDNEISMIPADVVETEGE